MDPATWTASFLGRPYADAEQRTELPLMLPERYAHLAAGASGSTANWPASYEAHPQFNGLCCVVNFQMTFGVGGGEDTQKFASPAASMVGSDDEDGVVAGCQLLQLVQQQQPATVLSSIAQTVATDDMEDMEQENPFPVSMTHSQVYTALEAAHADQEDDVAFVVGKGITAMHYTQADLKVIPALPHTDPARLFVLDMEAVQGRWYSGVSALYLCAGLLTSLVSDVTEGVHFKTVRIPECDPKRRHQVEKVIRHLHQHFPERLPASAIKRAFN